MNLYDMQLFMKASICGKKFEEGHFFLKCYTFLEVVNIFFLVISSEYLFILTGRICYLGFFFQADMFEGFFFEHFLFYANWFSEMVLPVKNATFW